jgi:hypothetical protein
MVAIPLFLYIGYSIKIYPIGVNAMATKHNLNKLYRVTSVVSDNRKYRNDYISIGISYTGQNFTVHGFTIQFQTSLTMDAETYDGNPKVCNDGLPYAGKVTCDLDEIDSLAILKNAMAKAKVLYQGRNDIDRLITGLRSLGYRQAVMADSNYYPVIYSIE